MMISNSLRLSKSEWRQVSDIASAMDWTRHSADFRNSGLEGNLDGRTSAALHQLLRYL